MKTKKKLDLANLESGFKTSKSSLKPKKNYPRFKDNLSHYFTFYSNDTGIHGFKYMGEQDRSLIEKFWWLILFCVSLYFGVYLIVQQWFKWDTSPVLVSFAQAPTPVWQIPFPALTICPETKSKQRNFNFTHFYHRFKKHIKGEDQLSDEEFTNFTNAALVCDLDKSEYIGMSKIADSSVTDFLVDIAPKWGDLFFSCFFTGSNMSCPDLFHPTITEEGVCFTANMLDKTELFTNNTDYMKNINEFDNSRLTEGWTLEKGYPKNSEVDTFPLRVISAGSTAGLYLVITSYKPDHDYACRGPVEGFKVLLHNPAEFPRIGKQYFRVPFEGETVTNIKPMMMTTSEGLRNYHAHERQCFFSEEKPLNFFKVYTQQNCQIECLTNYTLAKCGCVAFYMPHESATKVCGPGSKRCTIDAENAFLAKEVLSGISQQNSEEIQDLVANCDCMPSCSSLSYNAETTQGEFNFKEMFLAFRENISEFPGVQMTRVIMFFKEPQFITSERNELYGSTDFLANCGGLVGLFTGFSFLSVIEIIYYLTLRLVCNVKKYGRHYWSGAPELIESDAYLH